MGAKMKDISLIIQAGINPKTGLPARLGDPTNKDQIRKILRLIDEQDAVNRYKWYNLPLDISSEELERLLYYKGQLCFFYLEERKKFYVMPFALDGSIDFYGRYNSIHPVPMAEGTEDAKKYKDQVDAQRVLLSKLRLNVVKAPVDESTQTVESLKTSAVILWDYSRQLGQNIIPRQMVNEPLIDMIAEIPCFLRTSLIAATGIKGLRVPDESAASEVDKASKQVLAAALSAELGIPISSAVEIQELFEGPTGKAQEYLLAMQALENFRLSTYGLENGGLFEKKAHKLEEEQEMNTSTVGLVYADGLAIRQNFCNIVNSIWGTAIWCEPSESVLGVDNNGDGKSYDENMSGEHSGYEEEEGGNQ